MIDVSIRRMAEGDRGYILSSWLKSLWRFNPRDQWVGSRPWFAHWHAVLEQLATPERVLVACSPANAWQIFGWVCAEAPVLHYVCVKDLYRLNGLARRLLDETGRPTVCTFWTADYADQVQQKFGWKYQPSQLKVTPNAA